MALQHLRLSISACALALGVALAAQVVVWAMVHFTDVRTAEVDAQAAPDMRVVTSAEAAKKIAEAPVGEGDGPAAVNTVPSRNDVILRSTAPIVQTFGVIAALLLSILMWQAMAVCGGANMPGVERAVTAGTLTHLIVLLALPLGAVLPDTTYHGVFASYAKMVEASEALRAGGEHGPSGLVFYGMHFFLPGTLLIGLIVVVLRFRAGIEAGVIVTSVSQLDERIEREIRAAKLGQLAAPRAVGALNAAIGEQPEPEPPPAPAAIRPRSVEPVAVAPPAFRSAEAPRLESYKPGDSTRRPI